MGSLAFVFKFAFLDRFNEGRGQRRWCERGRLNNSRVQRSGRIDLRMKTSGHWAPADARPLCRLHYTGAMIENPLSLDRTTVQREVRYIQAAWSALVTPVSDALGDEVITDIMAWAARTRPLAKSETAIVTIFKPKTAALFADRVWVQWAGEDARLDFTFGWESPRAIRLAALFAFQHLTADERERASWQTMTPTDQTERFVVANERELALDYQVRTGAAVAPLYNSAQSREAQYQTGETPVVIAVVENLNIVAEESLSWEQVIEFRRDVAARLAYRNFIHWLDKDMIGKSVQFVVDEVSARMERYEWAMRKHGLHTMLGALESTLNANSLLGTSAAVLTVQSLSHESLLSVLAGGGLIVGKAAITAAVKLIERADIREAHRDIAFVYEARSRLKAPA